MSSTNTSSANFQSILNAALDSYARQTGIDLMKHPSADKLQSCASSEHVLQLLQDRETAFKDYRDKHRKLISCLRPVVQVIHAFSGVLGEVASLVSDSTLSDFIPMLIPSGAVPTDKSNYYWGRCSTFSEYLPYMLHPGNPHKYFAMSGRQWCKCKLRRPLRPIRLRWELPRTSSYLYRTYPTGTDHVRHSRKDYGRGARGTCRGDQANQTGSFQ